MEQTECSETSAYKIQTPGNYPEEKKHASSSSSSSTATKPSTLQLTVKHCKHVHNLHQEVDNGYKVF
jgi:hypothetical protein